MLSFSMFLDCIGMTTSTATLFILRKRHEGDDAVTGLLTRILPVITVLFISAYCFVATAVIIDKPFAALTGAGLLALFLVLYFLFHHGKKK